MSEHDDRVPMRHMLDHAREAVAMIGGRTRQEIASDRTFQLALTHLVEIVGEAATRVSPETRDRYPDIPWRQAINMRNRITHGYDVVDHDLVWDTVKEDFPPLIETLERALSRNA